MLKNNQHILFCVLGRTGAGKSSIVSKVAEQLDLFVLPSYATRDARETEIENINNDHIFISNEDFDKLENIVAHTEINGNRYASTLEQLLSSDIYVLDYNGLLYLQSKKLDNIKLVTLFITAPLETRAYRYMQRGGASRIEFNKRDSSESRQFDLFLESYCLDEIEDAFVITNSGSLENAVKNTIEIINKYQ